MTTLAKARGAPCRCSEIKIAAPKEKDRLEKENDRAIKFGIRSQRLSGSEQH